MMRHSEGSGYCYPVPALADIDEWISRWTTGDIRARLMDTMHQEIRSKGYKAGGVSLRRRRVHGSEPHLFCAADVRWDRITAEAYSVEVYDATDGLILVRMHPEPGYAARRGSYTVSWEDGIVLIVEVIR